MLGRLGRAMYVHRFVVLGVWSFVALSGALAGGAVYDRTQAVDSPGPDAPSSVAAARIDALSPEGEQVVAVISGRDFYATDLVDDVTRISYEIREIPGVADVEDAYTTGARMVSADSMTSVIRVELQPGLSESDASATADEVAAALHRIAAPTVLVGGELLAERDFAETAVADATRGESVALLVLCGVLIALLGGVVAGSLPLAAAVAAVTATLLALTGLASVVAVSEYAVNVVTLLGIGLAVDYSLLMIFRFRQERAADAAAPVPELLARTVAAAGRAVVVSGLAVCAALAGLVFFADPLLSAMAMGGAVVVVLATAAGLTLTPALIAVAHRRLPAVGTRTWIWRRPAREGPGSLARLAALAQRRPALTSLAVLALLSVMAAPLLSLNLADSDARALPASSEARQAYEAVEGNFTPGRTGPVAVLVEARTDAPAVREVVEAIQQMPQVIAIDLDPDVPPGATVLEVVPDGATSGAAAQRLVREIRALDAPVPLLVAGPAAELVDVKDGLARRLPIALAVIAVATGALLFALTGSVLVPLKALVLNGLTLLATLGVLVAVFQWGWGATLLGFQPWGALDVTTPLLLFVFIFGLSMDYEVFLLARIKEEWDRLALTAGAGADRATSDRAVLAGIVATGPVVTAAAGSIGIVFLGFAVGELVAVKEIGVGMAVAVLLDVTVVRGLLLPASMSLLGSSNWWRPAWGGRSPVRGAGAWAAPIIRHAPRP